MMTAQDPWDKPRRNPWPAVSLSFGLGAMLATARKEDKPPQAVTTSSAPEPSAAPAETPEPVRYRDDIVSDGRLLAYDLQELMQDQCERYGVPYALALATAAGINPRMLQYYEQGVKEISGAKLATLLKICLALNCKLEDILPDGETAELLRRYTMEQAG